MLSFINDLVLVEGFYGGEIYQMASSDTVPVVYIACSMHHPLQGLAHIMTIKEHFGECDDLTFAWIGPGNPTLNTYMGLLPKFGININFNCSTSPDKPVSPMLLKDTKEIIKESKMKIVEYDTPEGAIKGADIIATTSHGAPTQTITMKMLENANEDWILTHDLPRGKLEIEDDVFNHERNLVWQNFENHIFICMACIKQSLDKDATPCTSEE